MSIKTRLLKEQIKYVIDYLEPFLPFANFHMVEYFTKEAFEMHFPKQLKEDLKLLGNKEVINCIFNNDYAHLPNLNRYIEKSKELTLKNMEICLNTQDLQEKFLSLGCYEPIRLKLNVFMTSKKSHEVEILSYIAAALNSISGTTHLIDIGDGKGYLSSMLALHHKIPILGIDASEINTSGAISRVKKLSKVWKSVASNSNKLLEISPTHNECDFEEDKNLKLNSTDIYKQVTKFIDINIDVLELVSNIFLAKPNGVGIVGLHTCGDLAATSIRLFSKNETIKTMCNVGCCYHLLSECFENDNSDKATEVINGFPMSCFLLERQFKIGRAGRMIAAQSMERILDKKELPNKNIFYRALFEIILEKEFGENLHSDKRHVGKIRKKCESFVDYSKKALKRLNLSNKIADSELEELFEKYMERENELYLFYLLRNMLSPIIESLILLDRLLYLHELGIDESYIVHLFDPIVSPRCYGLVSIK